MRINFHFHHRPHVARPGLPKEMHVSRLLREFGNQVMRQVSEKSDEIDGMRLEKDVGILPSPWSVKLCTTNSAVKEPSSLNVTTQRIFIGADVDDAASTTEYLTNVLSSLSFALTS